MNAEKKPRSRVSSPPRTSLHVHHFLAVDTSELEWLSSYRVLIQRFDSTGRGRLTADGQI